MRERGSERGFLHSLPRNSRQANGFGARFDAHGRIGCAHRASGLRRKGGRSIRRRLTLSQSQRGADLAVDLAGQVWVVLEEHAGVLAPLAEADLAEGKPRAGLLDDLLGDSEIDQVTFFRDAFAVEDVELGGPERRSDLVLDDAQARAIAG